MRWMNLAWHGMAWHGRIQDHTNHDDDVGSGTSELMLIIVFRGKAISTGFSFHEGKKDLYILITVVITELMMIEGGESDVLLIYSLFTFSFTVKANLISLKNEPLYLINILNK